MYFLVVILDSIHWAVGSLLLAGVNNDKIVSFSGERKAASLTTGDFSVTNAQSLVNLARPIIDGGTGSVAIASRLNLDDDISYTSPVAADGENRIGLRSSGRYHRIRTVPSGLWNFALAVDVDLAQQSIR